MSGRANNKRRKVDIYGEYQYILWMPSLTDKEIDGMRKHLGLLAQTTCEHVWGKKLY